MSLNRYNGLQSTVPRAVAFVPRRAWSRVPARVLALHAQNEVSGFRYEDKHRRQKAAGGKFGSCTYFSTADLWEKNTAAYLQKFH